MAKSTALQNHTRKTRFFTPQHPLECRHYKDHSEIIALIGTDSVWKIVAEFHATAGISPLIMAKYVCQLINDNLRHQDILQDAMDTLELCLTEANMTFSTEQAADCVAERIRRQVIGACP